ncbi:MAG: Gfo/Idh/MocA family protein [Phycisphaeraceae bacterium JB051]
MISHNTPITMALVGLNFGKHIFNQLITDQDTLPVKLVGLCDLNQDKVKALLKNQPQLKVYASLDEILSDPDVQTVGLFTGPKGRAQLISKIIRAGKDVMTTKPFETSPQAAMKVLEQARELGRVIHMNSPGPGLNDDLATIKRWQDQYQLGRPVGARAEVWGNYHEQADGSWYDDPNICPAAPVFRLGIYLINDLIQLLGSVKQLSVMSSRIRTGRPTVDNAQLSLAFENGALANIYASLCVLDGDHYRNSLTMNFENGTIYRNVGPTRDDLNKASLQLVMGNDQTSRHIADEYIWTHQNGSYHWQAFADAVNGKPDAPGYDFEHIVEPLRVLNVLAEAEQTGQRVTIQRD